MEQQPITIEAVYQLATPAFIGGADPRHAEFRVPSFKGALRFWWRACVAATTSNVDELRQREAELFGSARLGRSRLTIAIASESRPPRCLQIRSELGPSAHAQHHGGQPRPKPRKAHGAWYLAYGVVEPGNGTLVRQAVEPRWTVRLRMRLATFEPRIGERSRDERKKFDSDAACKEIKHALIALGLFGGLGSKSRKGYGSLVLRELIIDDEPVWQPPTAPNQLADRIRTLYRECGTMPAVEPEWTALSGHARHLLVTPAGNIQAFDLLDMLGRELVRYRSWGKNGKILGGEPAEPRFPLDHDIAKGKGSGHPERVAFGLPHNYSGDGFFVVPASENRRASPLIIHIHECQGMPVAVLSFLPARFLPEGHEKVRMHWKNTRREIPVLLSSRPTLWKPICDFLELLKGKSDLFQVMKVEVP